MPKSQIIIDAVNGDVPIDKSLKRLQVLAHDVYNKELEKWAENELTGYLDSSEVPEYRETKSLNIVYSGFNLALQVNNVPLPIGYLDNDTLNEVVNVAIREDILSVQKFADTEPGGYRDLSFLAGEVLKKSGGIQCVSIQQLVPSSAYGKILAEVNNRIIRALMMLEDQHGKLDKLGIKIGPSKAAQGNATINENLGLPVQIVKKESWTSKVAWNIVIPIITGVVGTVLGALATIHMGLG
ncbi:MAG: hypothetical protein HXK00_08030 [Abiotrophia defectiva]|uniref:AbiTii domain-containing protein n=1 Tax=Abiotrophia defectiva TaxID=46125 RepID=A0A929MQS7_ABIDE|nr:hypothetical protein [Abiotrophia defectiva]